MLIFRLILMGKLNLVSGYPDGHFVISTSPAQEILEL
jgi:hypothetical protein